MRCMQLTTSMHQHLACTDYQRAPTISVHRQLAATYLRWPLLQAELTTGEPLFPGSSDIDQLHLQLQLLGPLPASMAASFCGNPHNAQLLPLPAKPVSSLKAW